MDRSPGFGSNATNSIRPIQTRFRYGCGVQNTLTLLATLTRKLIMQKARRHLAAPTACKRTVSDLFHSPHRGSFHLSLTVLIHYRSLVSI